MASGALSPNATTAWNEPVSTGRRVKGAWQESNGNWWREGAAEERDKKRGRVSSRPAAGPAAVRTPTPGPGSLANVLPHQLTHNGL